MAKPISKRTKKQIINAVFLIVLIAVTFIVLFTSQDISLTDIGKFLSDCHPGYVAGAFGGLLGYILFEAISLHVIARTLGRKTKFVSSVAYSSSDLYYSAITPSASGGQPASAYYMMRDGMSGGTAGFIVLFNIISYTAATILVGIFGIAAFPGMFGAIGHWLAKTLVIVGFVIQFILLALLLLCLFRARTILKIGGWGIALLTKMHIVKKPEKWNAKLDNVVTKYRSCRSVIKQHPMLFFVALFMNTAQRVSQTLIPCFVIMSSPQSAMYDVSFLELFCMQAYVMIGYNSIPLPGGTGVYEYLYPNVFGVGGYDMTFILSAMMVSRAISYYICMLVTGVYTLIYHAVGLRKIKDVPDIHEDLDVYSALDSPHVIEEISKSVELEPEKKKRKGKKDNNDNSDTQAGTEVDDSETPPTEPNEGPASDCTTEQSDITEQTKTEQEEEQHD